MEEPHLGGGEGRAHRPGSLKALYEGLKGWSDTAPEKAIRWYERQKWIEEHPGWTFRDYDEADAADILLNRDYRNMLSNLGQPDGK